MHGKKRRRHLSDNRVQGGNDHVKEKTPSAGSEFADPITHEIFDRMKYFTEIYRAVSTIAIGLRVTIPYFFARTVVIQYPDVEPAIQPRFRGFHHYEIERCIACEACANACPADCITIRKTKPRKMDRVRDIAYGGAITEYRINHGTCLFCGLCIEVCPTQCLKMGSIHDNSCYRREDLVTDYVKLAKAGRRTIEPIWLMKKNPPRWVLKVRNYWQSLDSDKRELMSQADDPGYCERLTPKAPESKEPSP